jgi:hypothetical protein
MKILYTPTKLRYETQEIINHANTIIREYQQDGYRITLRQLYYQFVSRNLVENNLKSYQRINTAIAKGRMGGMIDWDAIEDRTRNLISRPHWSNPREIIETCASQYHIDLWQDQERRVEVWIEKDALVGVIEKTCHHWDCSYMSCRGYTSLSEMHKAATRIIEANEQGYDYVLLYAGDHDPSGSDMSRDIQDRLNGFGADFEFERIALNLEQVQAHQLPPNRIKESDSRSQTYRQRFGADCWELDALPPSELNKIIERAIFEYVDDYSAFKTRQEEIETTKQQLALIAYDYSTVIANLMDDYSEE